MTKGKQRMGIALLPIESMICRIPCWKVGK